MNEFDDCQESSSFFSNNKHSIFKEKIACKMGKFTVRPDWHMTHEIYTLSILVCAAESEGCEVWSQQHNKWRDGYYNASSVYVQS